MYAFDDPNTQWDEYRLKVSETGGPTNEWISSPPSAMEARGGFGACVMNGSPALFGGYGHMSGNLHDTYVRSDMGLWKFLSDMPDSVEIRSGATLSPLSADYALLFGGFGEGNCLNDLHLVHLDSSLRPTVMSIHEFNITVDQLPPPRSAHSAVVLSQDRVLFHGGFGTNGSLDDLWEVKFLNQDLGGAVYTEATWEERHSSGDRPSARSGHSSVAIDENRALFFGGVGDEGSFSDLHLYDAKENHWTCMSDDVSVDGGPGPRYNHRSAIVEWGGTRYMIVTGGFCEDDEMGHPTGECRMLALDGI